MSAAIWPTLTASWPSRNCCSTHNSYRRVDGSASSSLTTARSLTRRPGQSRAVDLVGLSPERQALPPREPVEIDVDLHVDAADDRRGPTRAAVRIPEDVGDGVEAEDERRGLTGNGEGRSGPRGRPTPTGWRWSRRRTVCPRRPAAPPRCADRRPHPCWRSARCTSPASDSEGRRRGRMRRGSPAPSRADALRRPTGPMRPSPRPTGQRRAANVLPIGPDVQA